MNISYFPGGRPEAVEPAVDLGASPWGGGGGGGPLMTAERFHTSMTRRIPISGIFIRVQWL